MPASKKRARDRLSKAPPAVARWTGWRILVPGRRTLLVALAATSIGSTSLIFPGDAPWINDEPAIIGLALNFSDRVSPADSGLQGGLGLRHGPLPLWIYQVMLLVSEEPTDLILMRAGLVTAITAGSLGCLSRCLGWWPWFIPVVLSSPYLWFFSRHLWDNSFGIPFTAFFLACYAALLARPSRVRLLLSISALFMLALTHLMTLALVVPGALHLAWFHRPLFRRHWVAVSATCALWIVAAWPYLGVLSAAELVKSTVYSTTGNNWTFTLWGGTSLTATNFEIYVGDQTFIDRRSGGPKPAVQWAVRISAIGHALVWGGLVLAAGQAWRAIRDASQRTPVAHLSVVTVAAFALQTVIDGLANIHSYAHYFNGTWAVFLFFAWHSVEHLNRRHLAHWVTIPHVAALLIVLVAAISRIHTTAGTRTRVYGPALSEQTRVARVLSRFARESNINVCAECPSARFPHSLLVLHMLRPYQHQPGAPHGDLSIRYASDDPQNARLMVIDNRTSAVLSP